MLKIFTVCMTLAGFLLTSSVTYADSIYGACYNKSGQKCDYAVHRISTSWNSKKAFPRNGFYEINFGRSVDHRITVYCDGRSVGTVYVDGNVRFNVYCR
jgi:hypothetical protein